MVLSQIATAIALDVGTTNTRARWLREGRVIQTARRPVGLRDAIGPAGRDILSHALREAIQELTDAQEGLSPQVIVASGMLTAEVGLVHVPHVIAPAGELELARGAILRSLPDVADSPILFIPGIRYPGDPGEDGWVSADLMRGEECETLGAWLTLNEGTSSNLMNVSDRPSSESHANDAFVWPGSHTKLVEVNRQGKILRSHTTLAGELTVAIARHTLIAASLPANFPDDPDPKAVAVGAKLGATEGLGRSAFLVRVAGLNETLSPEERASFLIGALISDDVKSLSRHPILTQAGHVWVGGRQPQRSIYANLLRERLSSEVHALTDDLCEAASARGALAIAERHRILGP